MIKSFKYKLNQTKKQEHKLLGFFGCARFIYNWGLDKKIKLYESSKKSVSYVDLAKQLTLLKKESEYQWLKDCPNVCLQQSLRCLDNVFTRLFREKKGFPKFKSKRKSRQAIKFGNNIHVDPENLKICH